MCVKYLIARCEKVSISLSILGLEYFEYFKVIDGCCVYNTSDTCREYNGRVGGDVPALC